MLLNETFQFYAEPKADAIKSLDSFLSDTRKNRPTYDSARNASSRTILGGTAGAATLLGFLIQGTPSLKIALIALVASFGYYILEDKMGRIKREEILDRELYKEAGKYRGEIAETVGSTVQSPNFLEAYLKTRIAPERLAYSHWKDKSSNVRKAFVGAIGVITLGLYANEQTFVFRNQRIEQHPPKKDALPASARREKVIGGAPK